MFTLVTKCSFALIFVLIVVASTTVLWDASNWKVVHLLITHTHTHKSWCPLSVTMAFSCILAAHNADSLDSDWFIEICFPSLSIDLLVIYASIDSKLGVFRRLLHFKCMLTTTNDIDWYRIWWWWWWWVVVFVLFLMLFTFHLYCNYLTDSFSQLVKNKKERKTSADEQMHI